MTHSPRNRLTIAVVLSALLLLVFAPGIGVRHLFTTAQAAATIGFGPTTVVDDQRASGEPDIKVCGPNATWSYGNCGLDNSYASAPWGFSTTSSFVWRSEDAAKTFKLVPSNNATGKPDACPGGGDTDLALSPGATQSLDFLSFIDLQALTNFSDGVSPNGGQSWTCNAASSFATGVDRQWFGVYKNPAGAPANGSIVYLDYDIAAAGTLGTPPLPVCPPGYNANGNALVVQKSLDGGLTYSPVSVADCNDGIAGNMEVNQKTGHVFAVHTAYTSTSSVASDAIIVDRSTDNGTTWQPSTVFGCTPTPAVTPTSDCTVAQDFSVLAIDKSGGLYVVWSQAPIDGSANIVGPSHIYYSYSSKDGIPGSWSKPKKVNTGTTDINMFPWVAAGDAGKLDVVWYATNKHTDPSAAFPYDPGSQTGDWYPYMTQIMKANTGSPAISAPIKVSQYPHHNGGICTSGIGCTSGGDRSLVDFFQVTLDKAGGAEVIWADTSNNGNTSKSGNASALIHEARQISGPTLYGSILSGKLNICTGAPTSTPCQSDATGDAKYEANGIIGPNVPSMDITGSSVNLDPKNQSLIDVRMNIQKLSTLPSLGDTGVMDPYVDYMTSWIYHDPSHGQANYDSTGNIYYAYFEVNTATGAVTAYDGNTCSVDTTKPKYLVYPGQNAVDYSADGSTKSITLKVPRADVGNPPVGATLYSVTAHTVGQLNTAGPYDCSTRTPTGNNPDPSGQIFNVYDKSPAYTALLAPPKIKPGPGPGPAVRPGAPILSAHLTPDSNNIVLNWTQPDDHGFPITHFNIYRGTTSNGEKLLARVPGSQHSYTDNAPGQRVTYYYYVRAENAAGLGPKSNEVHVKV